MNVKEIVIKSPRVSKSDSVVKARALMRKNNIRALPVFDKNKLIGIITRSDIVKITSTKSNISVGGMLWKPLIKINANTEVSQAIKTIIRTKIKQAPVFDKDQYLGLVRDVDLLKATLKLKSKKKTVGEVMSKRTRSFSTTDTVDRVWFALKDHSGFPVVDKKGVVGIITTKELLNSKKARLARESKGGKRPARVEHVMRIIKGEEKRFLLNKETPIGEAVKKILKTNTSILPVVNGNLIGLVTKKDLLGGYV